MSYVRENHHRKISGQMIGITIYDVCTDDYLGIHVGSFWNGFRSGGKTCDNCESLGSAAEFFPSLLVFPCGVIALARPWSWYRLQDIRDPVVKVRVGIVAGIANCSNLLWLACIACCRNSVDYLCSSRMG